MFDEFEGGYRKVVQTEGFNDPNSVIPMEPFITRKAHTFLKDVLLEEKMAFGRQGQGIEHNVNELVDLY